MDNIANEILEGITAEMKNASLLVEGLNAIGYTCTFELDDTRLKCKESGISYPIYGLIVDEIFLMENFTDGLYDCLLYTLRTADNKVMGIFAAYPVTRRMRAKID